METHALVVISRWKRGKASEGGLSCAQRLKQANSNDSRMQRTWRDCSVSFTRYFLLMPWKRLCRHGVCQGCL